MVEEILLYILGISASVLVSGYMDIPWIPENKFSHKPTVIFPAPLITAGIIAGMTIIVSEIGIMSYLISIIVGVLIGFLIAKYLDLVLPKGGWKK